MRRWNWNRNGDKNDVIGVKTSTKFVIVNLVNIVCLDNKSKITIIGRKKIVLLIMTLSFMFVINKYKKPCYFDILAAKKNTFTKDK